MIPKNLNLPFINLKGVQICVLTNDIGFSEIHESYRNCNFILYIYVVNKLVQMYRYTRQENYQNLYSYCLSKDMVETRKIHNKFSTFPQVHHPKRLVRVLRLVEFSCPNVFWYFFSEFLCLTFLVGQFDTTNEWS